VVVEHITGGLLEQRHDAGFTSVQQPANERRSHQLATRSQA